MQNTFDPVIICLWVCFVAYLISIVIMLLFGTAFLFGWPRKLLKKKD